MKQAVRTIYGIGFLIIVALLSASVGLQIVKQIMPCLLCVAQRLCFAGMGILLLLGACFPSAHRFKWIFPGGTILLSLAGLYFSSRQIWLQSITSVDTQEVCGVSFDYLFKILPWHDFMHLVLNGNHDCAQHVFSILGLDLAVWSWMSFLFFLLASLCLIVRMRKHKDIV